MKYRKEIAAVLVFAALILATVLLLNGLGKKTGEEETGLVEDAVKQAVINCYAVEGAYPSALDYLRENYGLSYDEERYFVVYDCFASNQFPDVRVEERQVSDR